MMAQAKFPLNSTSRVATISALRAVPPFTYVNGAKYDAQGRIVVAG